MKKLEQKGLTFTWNVKCACYQFSLPPRAACPGAGTRIKDPRSMCNFCYAYYGRSGQMHAAKRILRRNLYAVQYLEYREILPAFMNLMDDAQSPGYFRWFGCGDIVSASLARVIAAVAWLFPKVLFWCPTQRKRLHVVLQESIEYLPNLKIRRSANRIGGSAPPGGHATLLPGQKPPKGSLVCPGKCGDCRLCWESKKRIVFPFHGSAVLRNILNKSRRENDF